MKVTYRRTGGFTGLVAGCDLDTGHMAPAEAEELVALIARCDALDETAALEEVRDAVVHEILLEDDDGVRRTFSFDELNVPPSAGPLLAYLQERAVPGKPE
jgi:hypothetical protein